MTRNCYFQLNQLGIIPIYPYISVKSIIPHLNSFHLIIQSIETAAISDKCYQICWHKTSYNCKTKLLTTIELRISEAKEII